MLIALNWTRALIALISIAKTASKKIRALIRSMKSLSPEVAQYLYKSTICHSSDPPPFLKGGVGGGVSKF